MTRCQHPHPWLARPVTPRPGDQVIAGVATSWSRAAGQGLTAALELYDRRGLLGDDTPMRVEIVVDDEVAAWVPASPHKNRDQWRARIADDYAFLHGRFQGHGLPIDLPTLTGDITRVDLHPTDTGTVTGPTHDAAPPTWS